MEKLLNEIYEEIKPDQEEKERLFDTSGELIEKIEKIKEEMDVDPEPKLVGSAARGTWLAGQQDIDIFLLFPQETSREELEKKGLEIGNKTTDDKGKEQYAEHPYIRAEIDGFDVDIVPCFDIEDPSKIRSSVDRTPHHQDYIKEELTAEKKRHVLIFKTFLKGIGAYGSELKIHGFSGYLSELLINEYGTFPNLIESAKKWGAKKIISKEREQKTLEQIFPEAPLIFPDPVDPKRNVAAAVSRKNYAKFVRAAQEFYSEPKREFFFPNSPTTDPEDLEKMMSRRKSKMLMINLNIPFDLVPDIIYPQLRKTKNKLVEELEERKFKILRSRSWAKGRKAIILLEFDVSELSSVRKHTGPPLRVNGKPFTEKHHESEQTMTGPYLDEEGRLIFEIERGETKARGATETILESNEGFGKHVEKAIESEGYEILEDEKCIERAKETDALEFLGGYLTHRLPWYR